MTAIKRFFMFAAAIIFLIMPLSAYGKDKTASIKAT
jgi:hypothetical protein